MALAAAIALLVALSLSHLASPLTLFDAVVILDNNTREPLAGSCSSNGAFIGTFAIPPRQSKEIRTDVLVEKRSVVICSLELEKYHLSGSFDVFDWGRDKNRCANRVCEWSIGQSGFYLLVNSNKFEFQFGWS